MSDGPEPDPRLCAAFAASGDMAYDRDLQHDAIAWLGDRDAAGLPFSEASSSGRRFDALIHPEDLPRRLEQLAALVPASPSYECAFRLRLAGGEVAWFHDRGRGVFAPSGGLLGLQGVLRRLSLAGGRALAEAGAPTGRDALTGLYGRVRVREALDHALDYCRRYATEGAYLVVGIDKLSMVNQAFGHEIADTVIVAIANRVANCIRASDLAGRVGGDNFGVVLSNCPRESAALAAERILEVVRGTTADTPAGPIPVTVAVGGVAFPDNAGSALDAMVKADVALQLAKREGGDCFIPYAQSEGELRAHRRKLVIAEQVHQALREERLRFAYQPIVDSATHAPVLYECLLRMAQPGGELLAAGEFLPVVEELGMVRAIDRRAFDLAVAELVRHPAIRLALNVSGLTAMHAPWLAHVSATLRRRPDIARRLMIEITETAGLEDIERCARFVATLHELGCRVALDDFGAGKSSFSHLKLLPVDMVKIDGSFVRNIAERPDNRMFVRTLIGLARNLGLVTVAECVETEEEAALLLAEGVHYLQGYAFGRPTTAPPWAVRAAQIALAAPSRVAG